MKKSHDKAQGQRKFLTGLRDRLPANSGKCGSNY